MGALHAEFLKLTRSQSWAVVAVLPVVMVLVGAVNSAAVDPAAGGGLPAGWDTMWLRSVVFYGLFPLAVGIAILASLVWRPEHRRASGSGSGSWNALLTSGVSSWRIVAAKTLVVAALAAVMQVVLLAAIVLVGKIAFGLPGLPPLRYAGLSALIVLASLPLAAWQSALSMMWRSFAAPIAVAFAGAAVGVVLLLAKLPGAIAWPYALLARVTQLGTGTFADPGTIGAGTVAVLVGVSLGLTGLVLAASAAILDRRLTGSA